VQEGQSFDRRVLQGGQVQVASRSEGRHVSSSGRLTFGGRHRDVGVWLGGREWWFKVFIRRAKAVGG
jgi:hypothetical protein